MNFDTNELYLSIPRSYFPAKQNAFNFLININDGGGVFNKLLFIK
ncbi:hypothetical protein TFUB22_01000 [Tannerella forsythia]|nr:hypothetical protein TFUB22_01000 [Tannerella forsythia]